MANDPGGVESSRPRGSLGRLGRGLGGRVQAVSRGPFAVGSLVWRDTRGRLVCTIVAKATYELGPGERAPIDNPLPLQEEDGHWDDNRDKSVHLPSDLAPFKKAAEVVIVGSAFAPEGRPTPTVTARVVVGSVDKAVSASRPRKIRADGTVEESPPATRFSLRYEHAAGGPETDNPIGIDPARSDDRGRRSIPQLLPPAFELGRPGDYVPTIGFGPIAPTWPSRTAGLGDLDRAWLDHPDDASLPKTFPSRFFQAAPMDQWLERPLAANERLLLEGLHASFPRLSMSLSGVEPWVIVIGSSDNPVRLSGDLLVIDTDRALCTLTFRAQLLLDESAPSVRALIVGMPLGTPVTLESVEPILQAEEGMMLAGATLSSPHPIEAEDSVETTSLALPPELLRADTLPFARRAPPAPPVPAPPAPVPPPPAPAPLRPSYPELVMPFRDAPAPAPPAPAPVPIPAPPSHPRLLPGLRSDPPVAPIAAGAALAGVKAASDAAAGRERPREIAPSPPQTDKSVSPVAPREAAVRRQAVVDLLFFDPKIPPRLRRMKRFAGVWAPPPRVLQSVDSPAEGAPDRERADVLRVLSCGRSAEAAEIHGALGESLDDLGDLDPPVLLVAGELRPAFDEVETLRAAVSIARPVASGDKKLLTALAVAEEALAAPFPPRPETALALCRSIEQSSGSLSLPSGYVAAQVERALLETRKYKRRTLLGAPRLRADLALARVGEALTIYLPEAVATSLPLLFAYPVVALCEVRPREDIAETQNEALFAVALGRVLHSRAEG